MPRHQQAQGPLGIIKEVTLFVGIVLGRATRKRYARERASWIQLFCFVKPRERVLVREAVGSHQPGNNGFARTLASGSEIGSCVGRAVAKVERVFHRGFCEGRSSFVCVFVVLFSHTHSTVFGNQL
jgi:hypothetical protein